MQQINRSDTWERLKTHLRKAPQGNGTALLFSKVSLLWSVFFSNALSEAHPADRVTDKCFFALYTILTQGSKAGRGRTRCSFQNTLSTVLQKTSEVYFISGKNIPNVSIKQSLEKKNTFLCNLNSSSDSTAFLLWTFALIISVSKYYVAQYSPS